MGSPAQRTSEADYLALDGASDRKHEYLNGLVVAMAGASPRHNLISANVTGALRAMLASTPCLVLGSDQRVRIGATRSYVYPDVTVVCSEPRFGADRPPSLENPLLVVEVLSPSTAENDRGLKLAHYRRLASLRDIVLIEANERRAELYRRLDNGQWLITDVVGGEIELASIDRSLSFGEVYAKADALPLDPTDA